MKEESKTVIGEETEISYQPLMSSSSMQKIRNTSKECFGMEQPYLRVMIKTQSFLQEIQDREYIQAYEKKERCHAVKIKGKNFK